MLELILILAFWFTPHESVTLHICGVTPKGIPIWCIVEPVDR